LAFPFFGFSLASDDADESSELAADDPLADVDPEAEPDADELPLASDDADELSLEDSFSFLPFPFFGFSLALELALERLMLSDALDEDDFEADDDAEDDESSVPK